MKQDAAGKKQSLATALSGLVRDKGWQKQLDMYSLFSEWEKIVDRTTADHARPLKVQRGVFWIEVDNSSWLHQLQFEKINILEKLNAALELSRITDIKFSVAAKPMDQTRRQKTKVSFSPVNPDELKAFENQAGVIDDEQSRQALIRLWYLSKTCRRHPSDQSHTGKTEKS